MHALTQASLWALHTLPLLLVAGEERRKDNELHAKGLCIWQREIPEGEDGGGDTETYQAESKEERDAWKPRNVASSGETKHIGPLPLSIQCFCFKTELSSTNVEYSAPRVSWDLPEGDTRPLVGKCRRQREDPSTVGDTDPNPYLLDSSSYGLGVIFCWYMVVFSIMVKWSADTTLRPRSRVRLSG
ncbi:hypothetical protein N657DRAFT_672087 [Parathielavia appendiculata]|uniref:Uncharacterized protein n=1 Tax=Parathielavia appendiculata TaxID=2587402 RepID=A0AAN6TYE6_9PEZI|nr:hypothetical protein N657DRAFT_672087 [Parathielavia appendiculata]